MPVEPKDVASLEEEKMKVIFMKVDKDGNGFVDENELMAFFHRIGLSLSNIDVKQVFQTIDIDNSKKITFDEFANYFKRVMCQENNGDPLESKFRSAFISADRDGSGIINFDEFAEYVWEKKRSVRLSHLLESFEKMDKDGDGEVSNKEFKQGLEKEFKSFGIAPEESRIEEIDQSSDLNHMLNSIYDETDSDELATFINDRWKSFASFKRRGASGEIVMKGSDNMVADYTPGNYSLTDLACFSDVPPIVPKHSVIRGVQWVSSAEKGKTGKCIFPADFDGKIVSDHATNEMLRYYGCSYANGNQLEVSLLHRHGIQDFTYGNQYLEDYVKNQNGGCGIEKHPFSHLDCPMEEDNGYIILGKFHTKGELHMTAFHIPVRHTVYVPGGVIHSNDHLKGKWRTMLSDEADIDHVSLVQPGTATEMKNVILNFM